ncbi:MAG: NAD-dependent epimerase/dehydratase family protein [Bacteroidota bacterium]
MKLLITGVHGFVGNNLVDYLKHQHTIYGLDILSPEKNGIEKTFNWTELDAIPAMDAVIHLAGKAHDTKNLADSKSYFDINTGLTQRIFDWFLSTNSTKFIFFSSVKAAADRVAGDMLTEDVFPEPKGPYGESKLAAERYLSEHPATGKSVYILRPCMIHGPGNKGNLNLLYVMQQRGLPWPLGAFENSRSFCSIDNILFVIQQMLVLEVPPGIYQVADDEALSTNNLIKLIAKSLNKNARIWNVPVKIINCIARAGDFLHLPLNSQRLKKLTESYIVQNKKIKKALGIVKMPVTAADGLQKTIKSFIK